MLALARSGGGVDAVAVAGCQIILYYLFYIPDPMSFSELDATPFGVLCWNFQ